MKHHPILYSTSRYGAWCHCICGEWKSRTFTRIAGAHLAFGRHLLDSR